MSKVIIIGGAGRMGQALIRCLLDGAVPGLELGGAVDVGTNPLQGQDLGEIVGRGRCGLTLNDNLPAAVDQGDVFIDFSFHAGICERLKLVSDAGKPVVIGTTGLTESEWAGIQDLGAKSPVLYAPNMSLGINLLASLVQDAAARLKGQGYDIEVTEAHHRRKLDAPSGTALFLGEAAAAGSGWQLKEVQKDGRSGIAKGERPEEEIGFHAVRGGDIVGDHTVMFATDGELLELSHRATSRDTFAIGALRAAHWMAQGRATGFYSMRDVLGLA